jgi:hypothetical protein
MNKAKKYFRPFAVFIFAVHRSLGWKAREREREKWFCGSEVVLLFADLMI